MKKLINLSIILILIFSSYSIAQQKDLWTTFTTKDGLANNKVVAICEDREGTLWFGTNGGGVSRFRDGVWTTFTVDSGLVTNYVEAIYEASDGSLWFGCCIGEGGVSRYQDGKWKKFPSYNGLVNNIQTIIESRDGAIWFGGIWGVSVYRNESWERFTSSNGLVDNTINAIFESSDGTMWFGTESGISKYKDGNWKNFTKFDGLVHNRVNGICESNDGALWFGTMEGISRFKNGSWTTFTTDSGLSNNGVRAVFKASDGALWFGTNQCISCYQDGTWRTFTTEDGLADFIVVAICESNDGALWFGTLGGVTRYQTQTWITYNVENSKLLSNLIFEIYKSKNGALWIGTGGGGVSYFKDEEWTTFTTDNGLTYNYVYDIFESSDGTLWFATPKGGISHYQDEKWTTYDTTNGLADNWVNSICESRDGILWFGTLGGVSRYYDGKWETFTTADGLVNNWVHTICESNDGSLWFGTYNGISRYKDGCWDTLTTESGMVHNRVFTIYQSIDNALWIGTLGGISRFYNGNWTTFTTADGLSDNYIHTIYESIDRAIWFGTATGGVNRYYNGNWVVFNSNDGLQSNSVLAIFESSDRSLWFGTRLGLSKVKPDKDPPLTIITEGPRNKDIIGISTPMFIFSGKDYRTKQDQLYYSWTVVYTSIIPDSNHWSPFSKITSVQPHFLQNGTYTFHVRAMDSWGNIDPTPATRTFTVDITQPITVIEYPAYNDTLSQIIPIIGYSYDDSPIKDFEYYSIYYGKGSDAKSITEWKTLVSNNRKEIRNDTLAIWDASGLRGTYQLKLFAKDTLDHISEDIVSVHIVDATQEIKARQGGCIVDAQNIIELCFPPNSFPENIEIKISMVYDINLDTTNYKYMGLCYDIMPKDLILNKPATLILSYSDSILVNVKDVNRLNIYRYNENDGNWILIGGTVDENINKITTSIKKLGRYGLFESFRVSGTLSLTDLNCQPRIFSPSGGGYSTETNISFYLGKDSNVTIKIYNLAGRLVNTLCENKFMTSGINNFAWDGKDSSNGFCVSGLYVVLIQAEEKSATKTVMVLNK